MKDKKHIVEKWQRIIAGVNGLFLSVRDYCRVIDINPVEELDFFLQEPYIISAK